MGMAPRDAEGPDEHGQGNHFTGHDIEAQREEMTHPGSHGTFTACSVVLWSGWGGGTLK